MSLLAASSQFTVIVVRIFIRIDTLVIELCTLCTVSLITQQHTFLRKAYATTPIVFEIIYRVLFDLSLLTTKLLSFNSLLNILVLLF